ncbi:TetR/AcrR family transcriptional regulator, partial [Dietzia cinnamea]|nr:TetR/AcrR family transcriptional regulator [Dietzia cinnamea]
MTAPEQRVPKQDRSRITRERLLGASIDLLATQGWGGAPRG